MAKVQELRLLCSLCRDFKPKFIVPHFLVPVEIEIEETDAGPCTVEPDTVIHCEPSPAPSIWCSVLFGLLALVKLTFALLALMSTLLGWSVALFIVGVRALVITPALALVLSSLGALCIPLWLPAVGLALA